MNIKKMLFMIGAVNVVVFVIVVALFLLNNYQLKTSVDRMINVDQAKTRSCF